MTQKGSGGHKVFEFLVYLRPILWNQNQNISCRVWRPLDHGSEVWLWLAHCPVVAALTGPTTTPALVSPRWRGLLTKVTTLGKVKDWGLPPPCPRNSLFIWSLCHSVCFYFLPLGLRSSPACSSDRCQSLGSSEKVEMVCKCSHFFPSYLQALHTNSWWGRSSSSTSLSPPQHI